jgi:phytanoyl-CoA hydroxylase
MVDDEWTPSPPKPSSSSSSSSSPSSSGKKGGAEGVGVTVFRTDSGQVDAQGRSDYFLDSASRVHFFVEADAVESATGALRGEYLAGGGKLRALNKAGHGLHMRPGPFADYSSSRKVSSLLRELGYVDPVVPQSMYIFKQAATVGGRMGGEVTSHQDSTFLHTEPRQTCVGLWLALDGATIENGCLWVRPGSHREGLRRRFVRNPGHFGDSLIYGGGDDDDHRGDRAEPQLIFRSANDGDDRGGAVPWEGSLPENSLPAPECAGLYKAGFVPIACEAGDLVAFAGTLDHLSLPNQSSGARHTFQLHCVEGEGAGVTWSRENWLQYPPGVSFMRL